LQERLDQLWANKLGPTDCSVALIFDNLVVWVDGIFVSTKRSCLDRLSGRTR
jgi:hypothetical protein